jgi:hypothetical protein
MATRALTTAEKFLFGYPLLSAIRKVAAIAVTLACLFYAFGVLKVAVFGAFGALCLSMMDLPGSPRQVIYAFGMGAALAFTSAAIIALTAAHPIWVTAAFTGLTWFFSTLVVYMASAVRSQALVAWC